MSVKRALVGCKRVIDYATKVKNLREAEFCWRLYRVTCAKPQSVESPATCLGKENALLSLLHPSVVLSTHILLLLLLLHLQMLLY